MNTSKVRAPIAPSAEALPEIDLRQLQRLTDDTGIFQHATHLLPDPTHGYCTDDNARALIAAVLHADLRGYDEQTVPLYRYLAFVAYAFNSDNGRFRNFMGYDRRWLEEAGSEDSHGRAVWSLGVTVERAPSAPIRDFAEQLLHKALPAVREQLEHLHPRAFALLGLTAHLRAIDDAAVTEVRDEVAHWLYDRWRAHASDDWPWWEDILTWGIARPPHAMLVAGHAMQHRDMIDAALRALQWALDVQTAPDGHLSIVGNDGWYVRGKRKAQFDQQPLEAHGLIDACLAAAEITGDEAWAQRAWRCFQWFHGDNDLGEPLYHPETGGCQDGLTATGPNQNQGAESTLAYLLSQLVLHQHHAHPSGAVNAGGNPAGGNPGHVRGGEEARIRIKPPRAVGLAVIGAGRFARFAAQHFHTLEQVKLCAVADVDAAAARQAAEALGVKAMAVDAALRQPEVTMAYIATPPWTHRELTQQALDAGRHVLCEKPLALGLEDAHAVIEQAQRRKLILATNLLMRYNPLCEAVKGVIEQRLLGEPLHAFFENHAKDEPLPPGHWFWDRQKSGGIFVEHGVHFFDLFAWWLGDCEIEAAQAVRRPETQLIEQVQCTCRHGPVLVNYHHNFTQAEVMDQQELCVLFERGSLRLREWVPTAMEVICLADDRTVATLQDVLPHAVVEQLAHYRGAERRVSSRHKSYTVDGRYRIIADAGMSKSQLYGHVLRSLLADQIAAIDDPNHVRRVSERNGYTSLELAITAQRLAEAHAG